MKKAVERKVLFYMKMNTKKMSQRFIVLALTGFTLFTLSGCDVFAFPSEDHELSSAIVKSEISEKTTQTETEKLQEQLVETPDVLTSDWNLILVNQSNPLADNVDFESYIASSGEVLDARIAPDFEAMLAAGEAEGIPFVFVSGYRPYELQEQIYENVLWGYLNNDKSEAEAKKLTEEYIAIPGTSEHMTGLAADISDPALYHLENGLVTEFEDTATAQWLYENAADYGFILRYPRDKKGIIDVKYESWHFRYVGRENAQYMDANNLTLEEYIALLQKNEAIREQISELSE